MALALALACGRLDDRAVGRVRMFFAAGRFRWLLRAAVGRGRRPAALTRDLDDGLTCPRCRPWTCFTERVDLVCAAGRAVPERAWPCRTDRRGAIVRGRA